MKSVAKEYTSMKCKEKEDLIEIRVIIIYSVIFNSVIIMIFIVIIIMTMISVCKTRTDFYASESTCLRPRAMNSQTSSFKARSA